MGQFIGKHTLLSKNGDTSEQLKNQTIFAKHDEIKE